MDLIYRIVSKLVDQLKIGEHVLFLGKQDNLEELYSFSDLMLLLSEKESFGLVALEALACGVPCIGTNVGGIPEVILDGENGYVCELGNINEIAGEGDSLLSNENLHRQFSQNGIAMVNENFRGEKIRSRI